MCGGGGGAPDTSGDIQTYNGNTLKREEGHYTPQFSNGSFVGRIHNQVTAPGGLVDTVHAGRANQSATAPNPVGTPGTDQPGGTRVTRTQTGSGLATGGAAPDNQGRTNRGSGLRM